MQVHAVDGTYELFRHFFAVPPSQDPSGREVGAVVGVVRSIVALLEDGATHVGVATDHVIESFRNDLWHGYKTGEGIDPALRSQFEPLEDALRWLGVRVWAMQEFEADDALASAAALAAADPRVERVFICTPDKDLAQCVVDGRVVQLDRRAGTLRDAAGVVAKFGVPPAAIPDYLALVGDNADGFPGLRGFGPKSAAAVLATFGRLEAIPRGSAQGWPASVRGADRLAAVLAEDWEQALLFRRLATLRTDALPATDTVDAWLWRGPSPELAAFCAGANAADIARRAKALAARRTGAPAPG
jgi:5'-3' exonuclease